MLEKNETEKLQRATGPNIICRGLNPENMGDIIDTWRLVFETWSRPPVELMGRIIKEAEYEYFLNPGSKLSEWGDDIHSYQAPVIWFIIW